MAETLLALGAPIEARDQHRVTPLMMAAQQGNLAVLEVLLEQGADPRARSVEGHTALDIAREKKKPAVIQALKKAQGT